jgi:hypothetical protein
MTPIHKAVDGRRIIAFLDKPSCCLPPFVVGKQTRVGQTPTMRALPTYVTARTVH